MANKEKVRVFIRENYAKVASGSVNGGCCGGGGCRCGGPKVDVKEVYSELGYTEEDILRAPAESNMGLGCGNPIALAALKAGETVLDLGCGGGFDCFLARERVGESGHVIGVDMTPEMISLARENARKSGYDNIEFRLGEIEHLPVADGSVDVIISNCVINLSIDKEQVFREAFRVLKPGGRVSISDVAATAELPKEIKDDLAMTAGCIAGAEYAGNIEKMLTDAGFQDVKLGPKENGRQIIGTWAPGRHLEEYVAPYLIEAIKA